jgi:hypothetical protein
VIALLVGVLIAAAIAAGAFLLIHDGGGGGVVAGNASSKPVQLQGVLGYDPQGDNRDEHTPDAAKATDKNTTTAWDTEHYRPGGFTKDGVGLVLMAPAPVALSKLTVLPGATPFEAQIKASDLSGGGFVNVSGSGWKPVNASQTTFSIDTGGKKYRYYMVWLRLPSKEGQAEIFEVRARS